MFYDDLFLRMVVQEDGTLGEEVMAAPESVDPCAPPQLSSFVEPEEVLNAQQSVQQILPSDIAAGDLLQIFYKQHIDKTQRFNQRTLQLRGEFYLLLEEYRQGKNGMTLISK